MKKSASAISGLAATITPRKASKIIYLELSDSDEEYWSPSAPKKSISDITPVSDYLNGPNHQSSLPNSPQFTTRPKEPEEIEPSFEESEPIPSASLLPKELELDVENRDTEFRSYEKPDIEDFCSSSSEFEIDDDSDDEWPASSSAPHANSSISTACTSTPIVISLDDSITDMKDTPGMLASSPSPSSSFTLAPKAQASIMNYFGGNYRDNGTMTPAKTVDMEKVSPFRQRLSNGSKPAVISAKPTTVAAIMAKPSSSAAPDKSREYWSNRQPTTRDAAPFYKRIAGTTFIVDAFQCIYKSPVTKSFFLSHFHSDHYGGLNTKFDRGLIYCSPITAALVISSLRVNPKYIVPIPLNTPTIIEGVEVTLYEANHCPGAAILLFRLPDGTLHLHTGDFRFDGDLPDHVALLALQGKISNLYLDTTYANPSYSFPPQQLVISSVLDLVAPYARDPHTLFLVGTYTIGKERMFLALAERFGLKFYAKPSKMKILKCLEIEAVLQEYATSNELEARIHIVPIFDLSLKKLEDLLDALPLLPAPITAGNKAPPRPRWNRIIAIRPTGWAYNSPKKASAKKNAANTSSITSFVHATSPVKRASAPVTQGISTSTSRRGAITIHSCPYSEHSSFSELCTFVRSLRPRWIIPTVNNRSREEVLQMVSNLRG